MILTNEQIQLISDSIKTDIQPYLNSINDELAYMLEVYKVNGLLNYNPLTVTQTGRSVDDIFQSIFQNVLNKSTILTRI